MMGNWWQKRFSKNNKAVVLMYHRIAAETIDPWKLCVTKENFEQQLSLLRSKYHVISVNELHQQLKEKAVKENTVCITFDDGYTDNYAVARPLLQQYKLPATFFITTNPVIYNKKYWWDELQHCILEGGELPSDFKIQTRDIHFQFNLNGASKLTDELKKAHEDWKDPAPRPTPRAELYYQLWKILKPLPFEHIQQVMQALPCSNDTNTKKDATPEVVTVDELIDLFHNPLFTPGLHTASHPALAFQSSAAQFAEIAKCKKDLEQIVNKIVDTISYPYGNYNAETIKVVRQLKINTGFSTEEKSIDHTSNPLALGRFMVENWTGIELENRLDRLFTNG